MRRTAGLAITFALLLGACSSEPTELVAGTTDSDTPQDVDETETETPTTTTPSTTTTASTDAPKEDVPESTTTSTSTTVVEATTTTSTAPSEIETTIEAIGDASIGIGEWAIIRPVEIAPDEECADGQLAFVVDGEVVHTYDDLAFNGGVRVFDGFRGQDAFVFNCEESVERIALAGSAVLPETGWPEIVNIDLAGTQFGFSSDFAWRGGLFGGYGSQVDGYDALFVIDPEDLTMVELDSRVGERGAIDIDPGVSLLTPFTWANLSDTVGRAISSPTSDSRVQVWIEPGAAPNPLAEGANETFVETMWIDLWDNAEQDQRRRVGSTEITEWYFISDGEGTLVVRHVPRCGDTVVIEMFADWDDSPVEKDLPWLTLDLLQVIDIDCAA